MNRSTIEEKVEIVNLKNQGNRLAEMRALMKILTGLFTSRAYIGIDRVLNGTNTNYTESTMIHVTAKAAAHIAERGGDLTLYSKTLSG